MFSKLEYTVVVTSNQITCIYSDTIDTYTIYYIKVKDIFENKIDAKKVKITTIVTKKTYTIR